MVNIPQHIRNSATNAEHGVVSLLLSTAARHGIQLPFSAEAWGACAWACASSAAFAAFSRSWRSTPARAVAYLRRRRASPRRGPPRKPPTGSGEVSIGTEERRDNSPHPHSLSSLYACDHFATLRNVESSAGAGSPARSRAGLQRSLKVDDAPWFPAWYGGNPWDRERERRRE